MITEKPPQVRRGKPADTVADASRNSGTLIRVVLLATGLLCSLLATATLLLRGKPGLAWLAPFTVGSALVLYGFGGIVRAMRARRLSMVRGIVIASGVREMLVAGRTGADIEFLPAVQVQYTTESGTFITNRFSLVRGDFRGEELETRNLVAPYPVGAVVDVYFDPASPERGCLRPAPSARRRSQYLAAIVGGVLVIAVALWVYAQS
jgi:hypothetical protein